MIAGETVDIDLPARDPEGERLEYEIVDAPGRGALQMRAPGDAPETPDVTYLAGEEVGADTFTYRVTDGAGRSRLATVTVDVQRRPDDAGGQAVGEAVRARTARDAADRARGHEARRPAQGRAGDRRAARAAVGRDLPHAPRDQALREPPQLRDPHQARRLPADHRARERQAREGAPQLRPASTCAACPRARFKVKIAVTLQRRQGPPLHPAVPHLCPEDQEGRPGMRSVLIAAAAVLRAGHRHARPARAPRPTIPASTTRWSAKVTGETWWDSERRRHPRRERGRARRGRAGVGRLQPRRRAPAR